MNLYDMAGNLWEWTQETAYIKDTKYNLNEKFNTYSYRGGAFPNSNSIYSVHFRSSAWAAFTDISLGFRPVLYIK